MQHFMDHSEENKKERKNPHFKIGMLNTTQKFNGLDRPISDEEEDASPQRGRHQLF